MTSIDVVTQIDVSALPDTLPVSDRAPSPATATTTDSYRRQLSRTLSQNSANRTEPSEPAPSDPPAPPSDSGTRTTGPTSSANGPSRQPETPAAPRSNDDPQPPASESDHTTDTADAALVQAVVVVDTAIPPMPEGLRTILDSTASTDPQVAELSAEPTGVVEKLQPPAGLFAEPPLTTPPTEQAILVTASPAKVAPQPSPGPESSAPAQFPENASPPPGSFTTEIAPPPPASDSAPLSLDSSSTQITQASPATNPPTPPTAAASAVANNTQAPVAPVATKVAGQDASDATTQPQAPAAAAASPTSQPDLTASDRAVAQLQNQLAESNPTTTAEGDKHAPASQDADAADVDGDLPQRAHVDAPRFADTARTSDLKHPRVLNTADPDFVDRLADFVRASADSGRSLRIRLHPPELGSLQIEVSIRDGVLTARLDVQTAGAQQTLLDSLPQLRHALAHNGTPVDRIDVHMAPPRGDDAQFHSHDRDQPRQHGQEQPANSERHQHSNDPDQEETQKRRPSQRQPAYADRLDVAI